MLKKNCFKCLILMMFLVCLQVNFGIKCNEKGFISTTIDIKNSGYKEVINPVWEKYNELSKEEQKKWGVIPEKYLKIYDYNKKIFQSDLNNLKVETTPSKYDLRNVNGVNYVTPVKNQGGLGLCWAFSTIASIESNILKKGLATSSNPVLFSENQFDYASANPVNALIEGYSPYEKVRKTYTARELGEGGNFNVAAKYLSTGISPVESNGTWSTYKETLEKRNASDVFSSSNVTYSVTDYVDIPYIDNWTATEIAKEENRQLIKNHIQQYGGLYVATLAPQTSSSTTCYAAVPDSSTNTFVPLINWHESCAYSGAHGMTIIGWDDDFNGSYCIVNGVVKAGTITGNVTTPMTEATCSSYNGQFVPVHGAWILKNSWGTAKQFPYLAYDSRYDDVTGVRNTIVKDWSNNYNILNRKSYSKTYSEYEETFNKLPDNNEELVRINIKHYSFNEKYKVYVKNGNSEYQLIETVTADLPGMFSVDIDNLPLTEETFSVLVQSTAYMGVKEITAFTNDAEEISEEIFDFSLNEVIDITSVYIYDQNDQYIETRSIAVIPYILQTRNVSNGEVTYKVYNSKGTLMSNEIFEMSDTYLINNYLSGDLYINENVPIDEYTLKIYVGGIQKSTSTFKIGIGSSGTGTVENPYIITNPDQLAQINSGPFYLASNYRLNNDIDMTTYFESDGSLYNNGKGWVPIGSTFPRFTGIFDGNNKIIKGLYINNSVDNNGLFGYVKNASIYNIKMEDAHIQGLNNVGAIVGVAKQTKIYNCYVENSIINGNLNVGSIIGYADNSAAYNLYSIGSTITGIDYVAGIAGEFDLIEQASKNSIVGGSQIGMHDVYFVGNISTTGTKAGITNGSISLYDLSWYKVNYINDGVTTTEMAMVNNAILPKTLEELKTISTFSTFDFTNTWEIRNNGAFPTLKALPYDFVTQVDVQEEIISLVVGTTAQLTYAATPYTAKNRKVSYSSSDSTIASVSNTGLVQMLKTGTATITVKSQDGTDVYDTVIITSDNGAMSILPSTLNPATIYDKKGGTVTIPIASTNIENGTNIGVTIKNSNNVDCTSSFTIAGNTINNNAANVVITVPNTSVASTYTVTFSSTGVTSKSTTFTIEPFISVQSISIQNTSVTIPSGTNTVIAYTINPTDATNKKVTWTSSDYTIASVSNSGIVSGLKNGIAIITATTEDGSKKDSIEVRVYEDILSLGSPTITGNSKTTDTTKLYSGYGGTVTIPVTTQVTKDNTDLSVTIRDSNSFNRTALFTITGKSVKNNSASILITVPTTLITGTYTVTVNNSNIGRESTTFTVLPPVSVESFSIQYANMPMKIGTNQEVLYIVNPTNATNKTIIWESSDPTIATISSTGVVTAVKTGIVTVTGTTDDGGITDLVEVRVYEDMLTLGTPQIEGKSQTGDPTKLYTGYGGTVTIPITTQVTKDNTYLGVTIKDANNVDCTSSFTVFGRNIINNSANMIVSVSSTVAAGTYTITVNNGSYANETKIFTIFPYISVQSMSINNSDIPVPIGFSVQISYTINPTNATNKTIIWESSDPTVATVSNTGMVTAVKTGIITITGTTVDGEKSDSVKIRAYKDILALGTPIITGNSATTNATRVYSGYGGTLKIPVTTEVTDNNTNLDITIKDANNIDCTSSFTITGNTIQNNSANILITVPTTTVSGTYNVIVANNSYATEIISFVVYPNIKVTSISADDIAVAKGKTTTINPTINPVDATVNKVTYLSNNTSVATIDSNGVVTAIENGTTTIKISATDGSNVTKTINVTVAENYNIESEEYEIENNYISQVEPKINKNTFTSNLIYNDTATLKIYNRSNLEISENAVIGTGMRVVLTKNNITSTYRVIVAGDVTGDGIVNIADVVKIADHTLNNNILVDEYDLKAANVTYDSNINIADVVKIADYTLNNSIDLWR